MPNIGQILRDFDIPWPAANEGSLQEAASIWQGLAETIRDQEGQANSNATSLTSNNAGAAISAFEKYWQKFGGTKGALPLGANACEAMANACTKYANAVADTKHKIITAAEEVGAVLVVGTIGAFFTFGATEAAADAAASWLTGVAAAAIDDLTGLVGAFIGESSIAVGSAIAAAGDAAADAIESDLATSLASSAIGGGAAGVGGTLFGDSAENAILQLNGEAPLSAAEAQKDLLLAGLAGGASGGVLGELGEMGAGQIANVLRNSADSVATSNPQLYVDMMTTAAQLEGTTGKVTAGVLASVTSQLLTAQQVSAEGVAQDQLTDLLTRAADGE